MNKEQIEEMRTKILKGLELAYKRLLVEKQKDDGYLVFSNNGKTEKVKARELS